MKVTFITVAYKTPHLIRNLLRSVEQATCAFSFEYIFVDNGGDGTAEMVQRLFPWVKVLTGHGNIGFGAGNNLGMKHAQGEYIMLNNPDLVFDASEMEKLVAFAEANNRIGFMGPQLFNPNGLIQKNVHHFPDPSIPVYRRTFLGKTSAGKKALRRYFMEDADLTSVIDVDCMIGAAILIRRKALEDVGNFDERYWMYFEDVDLCRRAWEKGWRVTLVPSVKMIHYHRRESRIKWPLQIVTNRMTRAHIVSAVHYFLSIGQRRYLDNIFYVES